MEPLEVKMRYLLSSETIEIRKGAIDCAVYRPTNPAQSEKTPVLLVCGWGSGWTGIRLIAIFLVILGYSVIIPSLPGTGDSFTPFRKDWSRNGFENEACWLNEFWRVIAKMNNWTKCHFVGHSTGCQIGVSMAAKWPDAFSKLVLLSPSGLEEISGFWGKLRFATKFFWSAYRHDRAFKNDEFLGKIWDKSNQQEAGPFWPWLRLRQRLDEFRRLCQGNLGREILGPNFPILGEDVLIMTGTEDSVFGETINKLRPVFEEFGMKVKVIDGGFHNLTKFLADEVAEVVCQHLSN